MSSSQPKENRDASIKRLRSDFDALVDIAMKEAGRRVIVYQRENPKSAKFRRFKMSAAAKTELFTVFASAYMEAIGLRAAQLRRLNRKLNRIDPKWTIRDDADLLVRLQAMIGDAP
jgi:hypothetical protein